MEPSSKILTDYDGSKATKLCKWLKVFAYVRRLKSKTDRLSWFSMFAELRQGNTMPGCAHAIVSCSGEVKKVFSYRSER